MKIRKENEGVRRRIEENLPNKEKKIQIQISQGNLYNEVNKNKIEKRRIIYGRVTCREDFEVHAIRIYQVLNIQQDGHGMGYHDSPRGTYKKNYRKVKTKTENIKF